jgi:lysozyme
MKPSQGCYDLIKSFEGCELSAYVDPGTGGLPITIGWGSTLDQNGKPFKLGDKISQYGADFLLEREVNEKALGVSKLLSKKIVTQNQFDSLVCFSYNVGIGALGKSTLLKKLLISTNDPTIKDEFLKWNKGGGKILSGLTKRREAEWNLFNQKP